MSTSRQGKADLARSSHPPLLLRHVQWSSETNFHVKMLPRARIPIIKLTMPPTPTVPFGMACDIGFENRLALENTRLLLTYAMIDSRLRTLVLFRESRWSQGATRLPTSKTPRAMS